MVMRFQPLPPQRQTKDREAETWSVRQFRQIKLVFEELIGVVYAVFVESLAAPLLIVEADDFVDVVQLVGRAERGLYEMTVSFTAEMGAINDQLHFLLLSDGVPLSAEFIVEAIAANELLPFSFTVPIELEGAFDFLLQCEIRGPGQADVTILTAHIILKRLQ